MKEEPKYYKLFCDYCNARDSKSSEIDCVKKEFIEECLSFLSKNLSYLDLSDFVEFFHQSVWTEVDFIDDEFVILIDKIMFSLFVTKLEVNLFLAEDNYQRWSLWNMLPDINHTKRELILNSMIYSFVFENNPSKEDIELIATHDTRIIYPQSGL
jgi:hypothetical protein